MLNKAWLHLLHTFFFRCSYQIHSGFSFLNLNDWTWIILYSFQVTHSCFQSLYSFFLFSSLARNSLFIHRGMLAFSSGNIFVRMHSSFAWERWSLNINHLSLLTSRALSHGTVPSRHLKKSALLRPGLWDCFLLSSLPSGYWISTSHSHCRQGCF